MMKRSCFLLVALAAILCTHSYTLLKYVRSNPRLPRTRSSRFPLHHVMTLSTHRSMTPGTAELDWSNLGFQFRHCNSYIKSIWRDGTWSDDELVNDEYIRIHVANTAFNYGQAVLEGMKAYAWNDGSVRLFRPIENAKRLRRSANRLLMEPFPEQRFVESIKKVVADNVAFVPPHDSGGSLYIRPLLVGTGPKIGLNPSDEYTFLTLVTPVGAYYKGGLSPVTAVVTLDYDRAAPLGVGNVKVAGNYAADLLPNCEYRNQGYPITLYLDAKEHKYIEEFSTSNFVGITKDGRYVTPDSESVLSSITNLSLMEIAEDEGLTVEKRRVRLEELGDFEEVFACGTAVVVTPVSKIVVDDKVHVIGNGGVGRRTQAFYDRLLGIQRGLIEDKFNWTTTIDTCD